MYKFSARARKDLEFKQNLLFEFWQKCRLLLIMRKSNRQNSRLAQNKIFIGVRIYSARQKQISNLNKTNTEFFSDSVKKNSQHVLTKRSLVYKFSARAGTDLELKTKVCPSFFAQFFFFRQCGVGSAGFYLHSAPRLEQAREA